MHRRGSGLCARKVWDKESPRVPASTSQSTLPQGGCTPYTCRFRYIPQGMVRIAAAWLQKTLTTPVCITEIKLGQRAAHCSAHCYLRCQCDQCCYIYIYKHNSTGSQAHRMQLEPGKHASKSFHMLLDGRLFRRLFGIYSCPRGLGKTRIDHFGHITLQLLTHIKYKGDCVESTPFHVLPPTVRPSTPHRGWTSHHSSTFSRFHGYIATFPSYISST